MADVPEAAWAIQTLVEAIAFYRSRLAGSHRVHCYGAEVKNARRASSGIGEN